MDIKEHTRDFATGDQIEPGDLDVLSAEGFTDIVCNRPDSEHPDGAVSDRMADAAERRGLKFHYLPVEVGGSNAEAVSGLAPLLDKPGVKVFAYCKSGARATAAWRKASGG